MFVNLENFHFTVTEEFRVFQTKDHILCKTGPPLSFPSGSGGPWSPLPAQGPFPSLSGRRCPGKPGGWAASAEGACCVPSPGPWAQRMPSAFLTRQPHQDQVTKPLSRLRGAQRPPHPFLSPRFCRLRPWLSAQPDLGKGPVSSSLAPTPAPVRAGGPPGCQESGEDTGSPATALPFGLQGAQHPSALLPTQPPNGAALDGPEVKTKAGAEPGS